MSGSQYQPNCVTEMKRIWNYFRPNNPLKSTLMISSNSDHLILKLIKLWRHVIVQSFCSFWFGDDEKNKVLSFRNQQLVGCKTSLVSGGHGEGGSSPPKQMNRIQIKDIRVEKSFSFFSLVHFSWLNVYIEDLERNEMITQFHSNNPQENFLSFSTLAKSEHEHIRNRFLKTCRISFRPQAGVWDETHTESNRHKNNEKSTSFT